MAAFIVSSCLELLSSDGGNLKRKCPGSQLLAVGLSKDTQNFATSNFVVCSLVKTFKIQNGLYQKLFSEEFSSKPCHQIVNTLFAFSTSRVSLNPLVIICPGDFVHLF